MLTFFNGSLTTTAVEQNLFDVSADGHFATWIFTHNMIAGDSITIRVYVHDENAATMRIYETRTYTEAQTNPAVFIPFLPTKQYKVTIQRIAGTDRLFSWMRIESS